jgi:hypothetical protein
VRSRHRNAEMTTVVTSATARIPTRISCESISLASRHVNECSLYVNSGPAGDIPMELRQDGSLTPTLWTKTPPAQGVSELINTKGNLSYQHPSADNQFDRLKVLNGHIGEIYTVSCENCLDFGTNTTNFLSEGATPPNFQTPESGCNSMISKKP